MPRVEMSEVHAAAEERLEESVPVQPGGTLYVHLDRGSVEVASHDASEVRIEASSRGWASGMVVFTLSREGNDVMLDGDLDSWFPSFMGGARIRVRILVPRRYSLDVETRGSHVSASEIGGRVAVQTSGGRIELHRIDGPAFLRTSGSRITAQEVNGDVRARTSGGRVQVAYVNGDVEARSSGGRIEIHGVVGEVDARTSGGRVDVSFVDEPSGRIETSGGLVEVLFPDGEGAELDARTSGGRVEVEHEIALHGRERRHQAVGQIAGGGPPLRVRTSGGDIRIRAA